MPWSDREESASAVASIINTDTHVHTPEATRIADPVTTPHDLKKEGSDNAPAPITQFVRFSAASLKDTVPLSRSTARACRGSPLPPTASIDPMPVSDRSGFGIWGFGFRIWGFGDLGIWDLGVQGFTCRGRCSDLKDQGLGLRVGN